jgi:hypothetical protein
MLSCTRDLDCDENCDLFIDSTFDDLTVTSEKLHLLPDFAAPCLTIFYHSDIDVTKIDDQARLVCTSPTQRMFGLRYPAMHVGS